MKTEDILIRPLGPGVYEPDRLRLSTDDGQRVVAIRRRDVGWLQEVLRDYRDDMPRDPLGYITLPASFVGAIGFALGFTIAYFIFR